MSTLVAGHTAVGVPYDFPHVCPGEACAIGRWLAARHTQTNYRTFERRSPDGDGQSLVGRSGDWAAAAAVDMKAPQNADYGTMRPKVQSDQQPVGVQGHGGKPQTVNAGGRVTEQYEPQLRRPRPQEAGSEPAGAHSLKTWPELVAEALS